MSLSDTVGFIRDLPHKLVEAFEATLQEAADADLLLHVVDAARPALVDQMAEVQRVLADIGAGHIPQVLVYNKLDRLEATQQPRALRDALELEGGVQATRVFISAVQGTGLDVLRDVIVEAVAGALTIDGAAPSEAALDEDGEAGIGDPLDPQPSAIVHTFART